MKKLINQAQPEGRSHPEIRPGDKWSDSHGSGIAISLVSESRVVYFRDGYEAPCICSPERLRREFSRVPAVQQTNGLERVMQATSCAERIRVMRSIIRERGKGQ